MVNSKDLAGSCQDWLKRAYSDLMLSKIDKPEGVLLNELCFHAEQAVEKSLKAVLIFKKIPFSKVHNIEYLLTLLATQVNIDVAIKEAASLTNYAVITRYPGDYEEIEKVDYEEAIGIAETVFNWAKSICSNP